MKKFLITCVIAFSLTTCLSQTFNSQRLDSLMLLMEKNNKFMGSIAINQNGKLLYSNTIGYADVGSSTKANDLTAYRIGSISKMYTASLILKAVEEKKIALTQHIDKYFPQIQNAKEITIANLLSHNSGIHDFTNDKNYLTYNTQPKSEKQMIEIIAATKSDFTPNSKVDYSNSNYIVLSYILEKIYKQPYSKILESKIIKPLKLKHTYFGNSTSIKANESHSYHFTGKWEKSTQTNLSIPMGAGGIISDPKDVTFFIEQLFNGKIVSQKSLDLMTTMNDFHGIGIGMGILEFKDFEQKTYGHNGSIDDFFSIVYYFPKEKLAITILSNGLSFPIQNVLECAASTYFNKPFVMPNFKTVEIDPKILESYLGEYTNQQMKMKIVITKSGKQLLAQVAGQNPFPLEASAVNIFKFEQAGVVVEFDSVKKQMILKQGGRELAFSKE